MSVEKGYSGLAAAIILAALRDYYCQRKACHKRSRIPTLQNAICVNCRRDAETFLYTDWCKALLDLLNIDRSALYHAMDSGRLAKAMIPKRGRPALTNCRIRHKMQSDLQADGTCQSG